MWKIQNQQHKTFDRERRLIKFRGILGGICKNENITKFPDNTCTNWRG